MTYIEILNTFILIVIAYILLKPSDAKKQTTLENNQTGQLIMDSSGLIDGRILELANSGFISSTICFCSDISKGKLNQNIDPFP